MNPQTAHTSESTAHIFLCGAIPMASLKASGLMQYGVRAESASNPCPAFAPVKKMETGNFQELFCISGNCSASTYTNLHKPT